jgi:glycosyltransferase involved in cell wall biosynthesis
MHNKQDSPKVLAKPLISFILTYYNLPLDMLCTCIDSILALSLQGDERQIIVVDDGSDESPVNALMGYGDDITYIRQRNQGLSQARNTGIQMARGNYLQFVDADDRLLKDAYEHCLKIVKTKNPEMVVFDFTTTAAKPKELKDLPPQSGSHYMRHYNIHGTACGYLFKRSVIGDIRFTTGIYHEDEEFTPLLMLRAENIIVTTAHAYLYQQRAGSITRNIAPQNQQKRLSDLKAIIQRLHKAADNMSIDDKTALQRRVAQLTMDYIYQVIYLSRSRQQLETEISDLTRNGLFPLPDASYTPKYIWFRRLSKTSAGRALLMRIIPLFNRER